VQVKSSSKALPDSATPKTNRISITHMLPGCMDFKGMYNSQSGGQLSAFELLTALLTSKCSESAEGIEMDT
jgi:hypothetical protein